MTYLLTLPWLPPDFAARVIPAINAQTIDFDGYRQRFFALRSLCDDLLAALTNEPAYGSDLIREAFMRAHDRPGYAHNMDEWNVEHAKRIRVV